MAFTGIVLLKNNLIQLVRSPDSFVQVRGQSAEAQQSPWSQESLQGAGRAGQWLQSRTMASRIGQSGPAGPGGGAGVSSPRAERAGAERGIKGAGGSGSEMKGEREETLCRPEANS